jgi:hypothetical protein
VPTLIDRNLGIENILLFFPIRLDQYNTGPLDVKRTAIAITHPNQKGLTSRTFEALSSGSKLITNNENCKMLGREYI